MDSLAILEIVGLVMFIFSNSLVVNTVVKLLGKDVNSGRTFDTLFLKSFVITTDRMNLSAVTYIGVQSHVLVTVVTWNFGLT